MRNLLKTAKVRNSLTCNGKENYGHHTVFNVERDRKGWDLNVGGIVCGVSGGFLFMSADGETPSLSRTNGFLPIDSSKYTELVLRFKYTSQLIEVESLAGKVQFTTVGNSVFSEESSAEFVIYPDGRWHTYRIDLSDHPRWVGLINNLKIFFSTEASIGDEIFLDSIRICNPNFQFCVTNCFQDFEETLISENFDEESLFSPPSDFSLVDVGAGRVIQVVRDSELNSNKVLSLEKEVSGLEGPTVIRNLDMPATLGYLSLKFKTVIGAGSFKLQTDAIMGRDAIALTISATGELQYRSGDIYTNFTVKNEIKFNSWNYLFIEFNSYESLFSVSLNGVELGRELPFRYSGLLKALRIENSGVSINKLVLDNIILVTATDSNIQCSGMGRQGYYSGKQVYIDTYAIVEGLNDRLIVNINNYGDYVITLPAAANMDVPALRSALEEQLVSLDLGGYVNAEVIFEDNCFSIKSGTFGFDSSVVVGKFLNSSLAVDLGFVTEEGVPVGYSVFGRPHAGGFSLANSNLVATKWLRRLVDNDTGDFVFFNPNLPQAEIGAKTAGRVSRGKKRTGSNKTIIDYHYRATSEGKISEVYFHGELPLESKVKAVGSLGRVAGNIFYPELAEDLGYYSLVTGDTLVIDDPDCLESGDYVIETVDAENNRIILDRSISLPSQDNLQFYIHNIAKIKHFRPNIAGVLQVINEGYIGQREAGKLYTYTPDTFKIAVDWDVHRGDFIGIYNAKYLYIGNDQSGKPDCSFLELEGDVTQVETSHLTPQGQGIAGIGLYGRAVDLSSTSMFDIAFESPTVVDTVEIKGKVAIETREYNLATAVDNGLSVESQVTGDHTHLVSDLSGNVEEIIHPNVAYNLHTLTDGVQYASNGYLGTFEENDPEATYFYIDGDAEFFLPKTEDGITAPSRESTGFPSSWGRISTLEYYKSVPFGILFSWQRAKTIHKIRVFFKEHPNLDGFYLEWLRDAAHKFDGSSVGFEKIGDGNFKEFDRVVLDNHILNRKNLSDEEELIRHFKTVYDGYITLSNVVNEGGALGAPFRAQNPYTVLEKNFTPLTTTALRLFCLHHMSTKISEFEVYSSESVNYSLEDSIELYFSTDGIRFHRAEALGSADGEVVSYKIGAPVNFLRVVCTPITRLSLSSIYASSSQDLIRYRDAASQATLAAVNLPLVKGEESIATKLSIINKTGVTSNLEVGIDTDELSESILVKSSLNTEEEVYLPEIGPRPFLVTDEDHKLRTTANVAINCNTFGLKNLANSRRFYVSKAVDSEADIFLNSINLDRWEPTYVNFPQPLLGLEFPGFSISPYKSSSGFPDPTLPAVATLTSKWRVEGSCQAFVSAIYDARESRANPLGSSIGIVDDIGRRIYIKKERVYYSAGIGGIRNSVTYKVVDSLSGELGSVEGLPDDFEVYRIGFDRKVSVDSDVLRFYFIDNVGGSGKSQWGDERFLEVSLTSLAVALEGSLRVFISNFWDAGGLYSTGGSSPEGPFVRINAFNFAGVSSLVQKTFKFDSALITGEDGYVGETNLSDFFADTKYVAVDLGKRYAIDILEIYSKVGNYLWDKHDVYFSSSEVEEVEDVVWGNGNYHNARWLLFFSPTTMVSSGPELYLEYLRIYPDITNLAEGMLFNSDWDDLASVLTDGKPETYITQLEYPVICLRLDNQFDVQNFSILDPRGREFLKAGLIGYEGWAPCYFAMSSSIVNSPREVDWLAWRELQGEEDKSVVAFKWLALKNTNFDISSGVTPVQKVSSIEVSTRGLRMDSIGETNDSVDFTEYSSWLNTGGEGLNNIAYVAPSLNNLEDILYGSSEQIKRFEGEVSSAACFDEDTETFIALKGQTPYVWRVFGDVIQTTATGSEFTISGEDFTYTLSGEVSYTYAVAYEERLMEGFEVVMPVNPPSLPNEIQLQVLSGTEPQEEASWVTIFQETDLVSSSPVDGSNSELIFNDGKDYVRYFNPPVAVSGVRIKFSDIVEAFSNREVCNVTQIRVLERLQRSISSVVELSNDPSIRQGGRRSLQVRYKAGNDVGVEISSPNSFNIGGDSKVSIQDYLSFYLKVSNVADLDVDRSYICIGNDSTYFYKWSFRQFSELSVSSLSKQKLKIKEAEIFPSYEGDEFPSKMTLTKDIKYFCMYLSPISRTTEDITLWLDNFCIERETFNLQGKNKTLYLNNGELLYYPLTGFNINRGMVELTVTPDWNNKGSREPAGVGGDELYTIFSTINEFSETFSVNYSMRLGLAVSVTTVDERFQFPIAFITELERYRPFKLTTLWDSEGEGIDSLENTTVRLFWNDKPIAKISRRWQFQYSRTCMLFIGSKAFLPDLADIGYNAVLQGGSAFSIYPNTFSVTGGVEDLLISSRPKKLNYAQIQALKDKILVSLDGVNFYSGSDITLPFIIEGVLPNEAVDVWIKTNLPKNTKNLSRKANLTTRWRLTY